MTDDRPESAIQTDILIELSRAGVTLFRQNTGMGWAGRVERRTQYAITLTPYRPLHAGLCVGSSDLIGWTPVVITKEHVGQTLAVFTAIEVKSMTGRNRKGQPEFSAAVRRSGGFAGFARSVVEALKIVRIK